MNKNIFYTYIGANKAIYILNLSTFDAASISLEFYKPLGWKKSVQKKIFFLYLCTLSLICKLFLFNFLKNVTEVRKYLFLNINNSINFNIDELCSVFVSSSGDKLIIHHHNKYYEKFAFNKSYDSVINELKIYNIFQNSNTSFLVSDVLDCNDSNEYCSFKLFNNFSEKKINIVSNNVLVNTLVEFFQVLPLQKTTISVICYNIRNIITIVPKDVYVFVEQILNKIQNSFGQEEVKLGLTHWDFKIWNVQPYSGKLQIYDFEETKLDGFPLEDLYNFYIDQKIMSGEQTKSIVNFIQGDFIFEQAAIYLDCLNIKTDKILLLLLYLINRVYFYEVNGSNYIAQRYLDVLKIIESEITTSFFGKVQ